jgi:hypothetical protein
MTNTLTEYFSAINTYSGFNAHKKAEAFLTQKQSEGFVGYQSTYGQYGFSVTYWPKPEVSESERVHAENLARVSSDAYRRAEKSVNRSLKAIRRNVNN